MNQTIKNVLLIIVGILAGYIIDGIVTNILAFLWITGNGLGSTLLIFESKIVVFILAVLIFFISKNKTVKWLATGVGIYTIVAYILFKYYFLPKSMDQLTEIFSQQIGNGNQPTENISELIEQLNKQDRKI